MSHLVVRVQLDFLHFVFSIQNGGTNVKPETTASTQRATVGTQRVHSLDILRGIAVFGILVVNVEQMFLPMFYANSPLPVIPGEVGFEIAWLITDIFFENKFLTLFSLLFGASFFLQSQGAKAKGRGFVAPFLRRLLLLAAFGVVHATFFYAADVLLLYALVALVLIPWRRARPRTLARVGGALVTSTIVWGTLLSGPDAPDTAERQRTAVAKVAEIRESGLVVLPEQEIHVSKRVDLAQHPSWEPLDGDGDDGDSDDGDRARIPAKEYSQPMPAAPAVLFLDKAAEPVQAVVEYSVYSRGPSSAARQDRLFFLSRLILLYAPVYLGWRTLGLFLLGACLVAAGRLNDQPSAFWRRWRFFGLALGLPLSIAASAIRFGAFESQSDWLYVGHLLHDVSSLLLAAGFAGTVFLWVSSSTAQSPLMRRFSAVGRTALSNYLGQSVVMSLLATSYGFGLFGDLTRLQLLALAVACFACQMAVSSWWLERFRNGPLEWLWRSFTYWKLLPLSRGARDPDFQEAT